MSTEIENATAKIRAMIAKISRLGEEWRQAYFKWRDSEEKDAKYLYGEAYRKKQLLLQAISEREELESILLKKHGYQFCEADMLLGSNPDSAK